VPGPVIADECCVSLPHDVPDLFSYAPRRLAPGSGLALGRDAHCRPFARWRVARSRAVGLAAPPLFNASLPRASGIHDLQQAILSRHLPLFSSRAFCGRAPARRGAGVLYLFTPTVHTGFAGLAATFARLPYTPFDHGLFGHAWGALTPREDLNSEGLTSCGCRAPCVYVGFALSLPGALVERTSTRDPCNHNRQP